LLPEDLARGAVETQRRVCNRTTTA
jgi:hypothetical protein